MLIIKKFAKEKAPLTGGAKLLAEEAGFEPAEPLGSTVFKTAALNHSAIPPFVRIRIAQFVKAQKRTLFFFKV